MVSFRLQLLSNSCWKSRPVELCVQNATYSHPPKEARIYFYNPHSLSYSMYRSPSPPCCEGKQSNCSLPGWVECDLGEFTVEDDNQGRPIEVKFSMREVHIPRLKSGFVLDGVIVRSHIVLNNLCRDKPTASAFVSEAWLRSFDDKYSDDDDESEDDEDDIGEDSENDEDDIGDGSEQDDYDSIDDSKGEHEDEFAQRRGRQK